MALPAWLAAALPGLFDKTVEVFDKKFQTDAEKAQAEFAFALAVQDQLKGVAEAEQANVTERHKADTASDTWLAKNVRPTALVYLMALFTAAFFWEVPPDVLEMLRDLLMTVFVFYFGSRTIEKVAGLMIGRKKA